MTWPNGTAPETFTRWDVVDHLKTEADIAAYLDACAEENDPVWMATALGDVARARSMSELARQTGLSCEGLYKALSASGNPSLDTVVRVAKALGFRLQFVPI